MNTKDGKIWEGYGRQFFVVFYPGPRKKIAVGTVSMPSMHQFSVCNALQISFTNFTVIIPDPKAKRAAMRDVIELVTKAEDLLKDYSGDLKSLSNSADNTWLR